MITLCKNISYTEIKEKIKKDFPGSDIVFLDDTIKDSSYIIQEIQSLSLFGNGRVIILSNIPEYFWNTIISTLSVIPTTTHIFWQEDFFPVAILRKIPDHNIWEKAPEKTKTIDPFIIANSLPSGDGKMLWKNYQLLIDQGNEPEAIFGILWWKLKDISKKQSSISKNFQKTFHRFLETYANGRNGTLDLGIGLEQLLLSLNKKDLT
jgi:hypothetical protein